MKLSINNKLQQELDYFQANKTYAVIWAILSRMFTLSALLMFMSLFLGFLNFFPFDDFGGFGYFGLSFMVLVLSIIIFTITRQELKRISIDFELEAMSNKTFFNAVNLLLAIVVMFLAFIIGSNYLQGEMNGQFVFRWVGGIAMLMVLFLLGSFFRLFERKFYDNYKKRVIPELIHAIDPNFEYNFERFIPQQLFDESKLYKYQTMWKYKGSNMVEGITEDCLFQFSQLSVTTKNVEKSQGKTKVEIKEIFNGIFYVTNFNKKFKGQTFLFPDYARQVFGFNFGEMLNEVMTLPGIELVKFEDTEFEKEFAVYSTDQVEARYILSTSLVYQIRELQKKLNNEVRIAFINDKLFMAVPFETDFLRPNIFSKINNIETVEKIYSKLKIFTDITKELRLNVKIWG